MQQVARALIKYPVVNLSLALRLLTTGIELELFRCTRATIVLLTGLWALFSAGADQLLISPQAWASEARWLSVVAEIGVISGVLEIFSRTRPMANHFWLTWTAVASVSVVVWGSNILLLRIGIPDGAAAFITLAGFIYGYGKVLDASNGFVMPYTMAGIVIAIATAVSYAVRTLYIMVIG